MDKFTKFIIWVFVIAFVALIGTFTFVERVPEGKVAVVYTAGSGAKKILEPGWNMIGIFDKTYELSTRKQIVSSEVSVTTNDGKKLTMPAKYELKFLSDSALDLFREFGARTEKYYKEEYLQQHLFKASRTVISKYSVLDIFGTKITQASDEITELFAKNALIKGFIIENVVLGNPEVDIDTQSAIDARVQAAQENELKKLQLANEEIEAAKKEVIANGEKAKKIIESEAISESAIIEAEGIAKSYRVLNDSLTDKVLQSRFYDVWDGKLPQVTSDNFTPMLQLNQ